MQTGTREWQSDYYKNMAAEATAAGKAQGKAEDILAFLEARGVVVDDATRTHVMACRDLGLLRDWLFRAADAEPGSDAVSVLGLHR